MMRAPDALPLHLMLALMQSGVSPAGWPGSSAPWQKFLPDWMRPKSPLEQGAEMVLNGWQSLSDQWAAQSQAWLQSVGPPPKEKNNPSEFLDPEFLTQLGTQAFEQSAAFIQGMTEFLGSDDPPQKKTYKKLWSRGSASMLDLAPERTDGLAILCVPSLINRSNILDLYPEASLVDYLKAQGHRPLILDWGTPGADELDFATADYIASYALDALRELREQHAGPIALLGYCMGGIFTVAMTQLAGLFVDALVLLATPWDFAAPDTPRVLLDPTTQVMLRQWIAGLNPVPPSVSQTVFHLIDPWHVQRKYSRYPFLSAPEQKHFRAVEQWVNDGVPLARGVAEECFVDWPQKNILATHQWKVGRRWIEPASIQCPTLAFVPQRDLIVPTGCALPLTAEIPRCQTHEPDAGHVSMVVGKNAKKELWEPLAAWLAEKF